MEAPAVVFGGTGFLGRAIVTALAAHGRPVRVAARRPATHALPGDPEPYSVDVRDAAGIAAAIDGAGAVINAVSLYVEAGDLDFEAIHVHGAERVARLAAAAGADRLIHVSGIGVDPGSESRYVRARARGEAAVRAAFPAATVLRPSVIFGPNDHFLAALDRVTRLPVIPLFGDGGTRLQPVHVRDVARAVDAGLSAPDTAGTTFELGGAEVLRYRAIVEAVLRHRRRRRAVVPVPFGIWRAIARAGALLPNPPVTLDQVVLMSTDNIVGRGAATFADLGIEPCGLVGALPACLGSVGATPHAR